MQSLTATLASLTITGPVPRVTLTTGVAVPLTDLQPGRDRVWSWSGTGMTPAPAPVLQWGGRSRSVKLTLRDGRTITCPPSLRFLIWRPTTGYLWETADAIVPREDLLLCSMEGPEDRSEPDSRWSLTVGDTRFDMSETRRPATLALARLLGYLNSDGTLGVYGTSVICSLPLGHRLDAEAAVADIALLCGISPPINFVTGDEAHGSVYVVRVPVRLARLFLALPGQEVGRRSQLSQLSWPHFLSDPSCPLPVLREFVAGILGGDGHSPVLTPVSRRDPWDLRQVSLLSMSTREENGATLRSKMVLFASMLERLGVGPCYVPDTPTIIALETKTGTRYLASYSVLQRQLYRTSVAERVGFRYCVHKQMRLTAASSLWRFLERIREDRLTALAYGKVIKAEQGWPAHRALTTAVTAILQRQDLVHPPSVASLSLPYFYQYLQGRPTPDTHIHRDSDIPHTWDWLLSTGTLDLFRDGAYAVPRTRDDLPVLFLSLLSREEVGEQEQYWVNSASPVSLLLNGCVVSPVGGPLPAVAAVSLVVKPDPPPPTLVLVTE